MPTQTKIQYIDLLHELKHQKDFSLFGRTKEQSRVWRATQKTNSNNCLVIGPRGIGKTTLIRSLSKLAQNQTKGVMIELETSSFFGLTSAKNINFYEEALMHLPAGIVILENIQEILLKSESSLNQFNQIFSHLFSSKKHSVILSGDEELLNWLESQVGNFLHNFNVVQIKPLPEEKEIEIIKNLTQNLKLSDHLIESTVKLVQRFSRLGHLPTSALNLISEAKDLGDLSMDSILEIAAEKLGVPAGQLKGNDISLLKNLESELQKRVIGQNEATSKIAQIIARSRLGLKNPNRPLGSFLLLGPSGVGKTETAKALTDLIFGNQNMIRLDMSEFSEAHTAQRLIGAPAGYVGYEEGGELTNAVSKDPYCLILLDELEKAHTRVFDIFLQILDDGRLTSGAGQTVDFTNTIIIATSNAGTNAILEKFQARQSLTSQESLKEIHTILSQHFRPEFLNRFDAITIFKPFSESDLLKIAELEVDKLSKRLAFRGLGFSLQKEELKKQIANLADPRYGARPIKRFVEETCETLISQSILAENP